MKKVIKILIQIAIIYIIFLAGNATNRIISPVINIPGSLLGMFILFVMLCTNILKIDMVEETGSFLLKYMGFFFVPVTVGIMDTYGLIQHDFIKLMLILIISCICVMYVSCKVTDLLILYAERNKQNA
mgnify:FL=1